MVTGSGLPETWDLEVLLVPLHCSLCTLWIMPVPVLPTTQRLPRREERGSLMVWLMSTRRHLHLMVLLGFTVVSTSHVLVSVYLGLYDSLKPVLLTGKLQVTNTF